MYVFSLVHLNAVYPLQMNMSVYLHVLLQFGSLYFSSFYSVNNLCCKITTWCVKVDVAVLSHYFVQNNNLSDKSGWKTFPSDAGDSSSAVRRASVYFTVRERETEQCDAWIVTPQMDPRELQQSVFWIISKLDFMRTWYTRESDRKMNLLLSFFI